MKLKCWLPFLYLIIMTGCQDHSWVNSDVNKSRRLFQTDQFTAKAVQPAASKKWGIVIQLDGLSAVRQLTPVIVAYYRGAHNIKRDSTGYDTISKEGDQFIGKAQVKVTDDTKLKVVDTWGLQDGLLKLGRQITVQGGQKKGGFLTSFTIGLNPELSWPDVQWFAPGMIYGGWENLSAKAIGGKTFYDSTGYFVQIREDRLPAPLFGAHFKDGSSLTIFDSSPNGRTTKKDALQIKPKALIDAGFRFGSIGGNEQDGKLAMGYWYPGTEGEVTYKGNTYPNGQLHQWRRRYHPLKDGFTQHYELALRFKKKESLQNFYKRSWRTAWKLLDPEPKHYNIDEVRTALVNVLASQVRTANGNTGIPLAVSATTGEVANRRGMYNATLGFTGRNIASAYHLLRAAYRSEGQRADNLRMKAMNIIHTFLKLSTNPPRYFGIQLQTGTLLRQHRPDYLRYFTDASLSLLKAYQLEKSRGHDHPEWLGWVQDLATWLLAHQEEKGGFPRSWKSGSVKIINANSQSSYNAIPFLVRLYHITGNQHYLDAAIRAGDLCWSRGQADYQFVGGTIDNPNIIDKEAGTISLKAYLALYKATGKEKWLNRAKTAGNFAETWIYIRNIPMPKNESNDILEWKKGVSTIGVQLIATGHSLVDEYMSFDVDEYAKLYYYTHDPHYLKVARILLHNTKNMMALPGRTYDLHGVGWQQEHWSMAPPRGIGLHRLWLPWVSVSQLQGIDGLQAFNSSLYKKLTAKKNDENVEEQKISTPNTK